MKTRLEILCAIHKQQGGTIHEFNKKYFGVYNRDYGQNEDFLSMSNRQFFKTIYMIELKKSHEQKPGRYAWPEGELMEVFGRMCTAIDKGSFNKDSDAFKRTCKVLGIKHTYRDIESFING